MKKLFRNLFTVSLFVGIILQCNLVFGTVQKSNEKEVNKSVKLEIIKQTVETQIQKIIDFVNPLTGDKSFAVTIVLWWFLGGLGIHNFYLGYTKRATTELLLCLFSWLVIPAIILLVMWVIDGINILTQKTLPVGGNYN
jgi:TM2 domain-containing membrane protein YozV